MPPSRRALLSGVSSLALPVVAGCTTDGGVAHDPTDEPTPPPNVTTFTETKPMPTPTDIRGSAAAVSFVERHEQRYVFNQLVEGFGGTQPATELSVEPAHVAVAFRTERGYYLLSSCSGSAAYYDPGGSSGMNLYETGVAHFVGEGIHRRIPFNAYRCHEPVVSAPESREDASLPRFQLYDFETPSDADLRTEDGHQVEVVVRNGAGEVVLNRQYWTSIPLTVQPNVTRTPGEYTLSATLDGTQQVTHEWSLSGAEQPSWWALALVVTNGGDLVVRTLYPNETVGVQSETLCGRVGEH